MHKMHKKLLNNPHIQDAIAFLASLYIRFVFRTTKWDYQGFEYPEKYLKEGKPFITCFWHGRLLMLPYGWVWKQHPMHMLISAHKDGQLISKTVAHFGIRTVAGSTRRGGAKALKHLISLLKTNHIIGITPDGPRGPREQVSDGTLIASYLSGADILPLTYATKNHKRFGSWDKFMLALPFSRGALCWGPPIKAVTKKDQMPHKQKEVAEALTTLNTQADALCKQRS